MEERSCGEIKMFVDIIGTYNVRIRVMQLAYERSNFKQVGINLGERKSNGRNSEENMIERL